MQKDRIKKWLMIGVIIETVVILALVGHTYRLNKNLLNSRLTLLTAVYRDLQCDIARAEQNDFAEWPYDTDATGRIYFDSGGYADEEDDQRLIASVTDYAYSSGRLKKEERRFLSELKDMEAAMQNDGKRFSKSRVIFFEDEDREKVKAFLEEKGRF
ncbi:MAG: hypothetical protein ACLRJC_18080 [Emergencia timonensis]|uniref:hypothetical protein n=1 Tax=Emergencia timonensis TaxID=1776384 RepID=UPI000835F0E5|nr:hypothetical protein [Emergencia timonensis]WNX87902.1 hypothetical protein RVY71_17075 [Emergencia timonensis]